jgi:hypothetical protein
VLSDAAGFAFGDIAQPDGVQQRCLAVVDVAHDGDHGRAAHHIGLDLGQIDIYRRLLFVAELACCGAEGLGKFLGQLEIEGLVNCGEDLLAYQAGDYQAGPDAQLFGKFLDGNALGDRNVLIRRDDIVQFLLAAGRLK